MPTYVQLAERLLQFENGEFGVGATEAQIREAEQLLGIPIAGGYRSFLSQFGWGGVEHLELYGLGVDTPDHLRLVRVTQSERSEMVPRLREQLLPVMNDGAGNLYCVDTSTTAAEPPVVFWDHARDGGQRVEIEARDFASWLHRQLDHLVD